jgi:hypothetical protein
MQLALLATVADESRTMLPSGPILRQARRRHAPLPCRSLRRCRSPVYRISVSPPTPDPARVWSASKVQPPRAELRRYLFCWSLISFLSLFTPRCNSERSCACFWRNSDSFLWLYRCSNVPPKPRNPMIAMMITMTDVEFTRLTSYCPPPAGAGAGPPPRASLIFCSVF